MWGKLTVHWHLDTNGAPSWKPLPFLFTVPYALFGHLALWLWMVTAVAVSLAGPVFAWRIALVLVDAPRERRWAGHLAGAVAAVALLGIRDYSHFILSAQSDTMIVTLCLAAIDCGLRGHRRWALWLWTAGGARPARGVAVPRRPRPVVVADSSRAGAGRSCCRRARARRCGSGSRR